jgi:hypothetical protein
MANTLNISNAGTSNLSTLITDYKADTKTIDGVGSNEETTYINSNWAKQWGYFNTNADLKSAILGKVVWVVGKGYTTDPETKVILEHIQGWGKDTFDDILYNMEIIKRVGGDSFAEIIRDPETDILINLKPLDPSTIKIVVGKNGMIKRYEQITTNQKFKPEEILHLSNNRLADQIHGISDIDAVEPILLAQMESFYDTKKIMHRQAKPLIMFKLGTDDATKISAFVTKMDQATQKGENIYIPDDDNAVSYEVVQVSPSPMVMQWRDDIRKGFYRTIGLPELLPSGGGDSTESGGKIGYLAFEQIVEKEQRYIEMQLWAQLFIKINLNPPASLAENLQEDNAKDPNAFMPNDVMAGVGE